MLDISTELLRIVGCRAWVDERVVENIGTLESYEKFQKRRLAQL